MVSDISDRADEMEDVTVRDLVWDAVHEQIQRMPTSFRLFRIRDRAGLSKSRDRTIRRTLNAMSELGWVEKEGKRWELGEKAEEVYW